MATRKRTRRRPASATTETDTSASLERFLGQEAAAEAALEHDRERERHSQLAAKNRVLTRRVFALEEQLAAVEEIGRIRPSVPSWVARPRASKGKLHQATPCLLLSDLHLDEIVNPDEVEGMNAYNREIARQRLRRLHDRILVLTQKYYAGLQYPGLVVLMGGDLVSGTIHEELVETNEDSLYGTLDFWASELTGMLDGLAKVFGHVLCAGVVGNHGRRTHRPRMKGRIRDNADWLLYRILARATVPEVEWVIPESADVDVTVAGTTYKLTHGDQFRGGSGISGFMAPLSLGLHRKTARQMSLDKPFDWLVMGHWHQYMHARHLIVNSALKGFDEFAYLQNFSFERAQQAFWLTTPENGASFASPIFCDDRAAEGW